MVPRFYHAATPLVDASLVRDERPEVDPSSAGSLCRARRFDHEDRGEPHARERVITGRIARH
jgi:hypothetical protein